MTTTQKQIQILNQKISLAEATDLVRQSVQTLYSKLKERRAEKHFIPEVTIRIYDSDKSSFGLSQNVIDGKNGWASQISTRKPVFDIVLESTMHHSLEKTCVIYIYDIEKGVAVKSPEFPTFIGYGHKFVEFEKMTEDIVQSVCIMIMKKAEEEISILNHWKKILG